MQVLTFTFPGINPEPWAVGPVGWRTQGGKRIPTIGPVLQLVNYQQALQVELRKHDLPAPANTFIRLEFYFWRRLDVYKTSKSREVEAKVSDATNMQKGTEDALQGLLFVNDKQVQDIRSVVVDQGPNVSPGVIIKVGYMDRVVPHLNVQAEILEEFLAKKDGVFDPDELDNILRM